MGSLQLPNLPVEAGQLDHERRPGSGTVAERRDLTPMGGDDAPRDGQAEPEAGDGLRAMLALAERIEDERQQIRRDARAAVANAQHDASGGRLHLNDDVAAVRRELDGIA